MDLDRGEFRIERSLGSRSTGLVVDPPKAERGRRTIRLPAVAVEVLRRHKRQQQEHLARFSEIYEHNNLVFADEVGRFVNPMNLTRAVKALAARVGHSTCATMTSGNFKLPRRWTLTCRSPKSRPASGILIR